MTKSWFRRFSDRVCSNLLRSQTWDLSRYVSQVRDEAMLRTTLWVSLPSLLPQTRGREGAGEHQRLLPSAPAPTRVALKSMLLLPPMDPHKWLFKTIIIYGIEFAGYTFWLALKLRQDRLSLYILGSSCDIVRKQKSISILKIKSEVFLKSIIFQRKRS